MRYVFDTEFWERGNEYPIIPISIGIVAEDGREFYAVNTQAPWAAIKRESPWLEENVVPFLADEPAYLTIPADIARLITKFVGIDPDPEFWAYFADYDWVVFCQLFGTMITLPKNFPMYCLDVKQLMKDLGVKRVELPDQDGIEHNALSDARWTKQCLDYLLAKKLRMR
jgi:hypothetical protein